MTREGKVKIKERSHHLFTEPRGLKHGSMPPHLLINNLLSVSKTTRTLSYKQVLYNAQLFVFI